MNRLLERKDLLLGFIYVITALIVAATLAGGH